MTFGGIASIWVARCLGPQQLGVSGMVQSIVSQATLLLGAAFSTVLIRDFIYDRSDEMRAELVYAYMAFRLLGACAIGLVACAIMIAGILPHDYQISGWLFIPLLFFGVLQPAWVFQASEKQHFQSMIYVLQSFLTGVAYVSILRPGAPATAELTIITCITGSLTIVYGLSLHRLIPTSRSLLNLRSLAVIWPIIRRSRWLYVSSLAIYVYSSMEQPMVGWLASSTELGKYRTAVLSVNAANSFFLIIPNVLYPRFIEWQKRGLDLLWERQRRLAFAFACGGLAAVVLGAFLVPILYPLVFGNAFAGAAVPCVILFAAKVVVIVTGVFYWGLMTDDKYDKPISLALIGIG
ncbi:MAG: oligosaccharide flippase family protein, partial [Steroidobacteraceae bacterium]